MLLGDLDCHGGKHTSLLFFFFNIKCEISLKKVKNEVSNLRRIMQLLILARCVGAALDLNSRLEPSLEKKQAAWDRWSGSSRERGLLEAGHQC